MVRSTSLKRSAGCISGVPDYSRCIPVSGIIIAVLLIFFCGGVSAETAVDDVVLAVSPGIAGESQVWNVSFHINQGLVNETNGFFITFDQSFMVDDPFDPECITVWSNGRIAQPHRVIIIHNPNESYPLYQPGTTTVKFNNPMDIQFNSDVLISFSCGVHTDCPINCSGYHVWANTDRESYPVESNYVYIRIPVTAVAGENGMIQSPDGNFSPPDHTQVFDCGSEPLYLITPDSSYNITNVMVDDVSVINDPNYSLFPDGHAEYVFDPLHCDHVIHALFNITPRPELTKTASDPIVTPGMTFFYTIEYNNTNEMPLTGVFITDPLPDEVDFINASCNGTPEGRTVIWDLGSLLPFESGNVTLTVMVNGSAPVGTFLNCAEILTDQSGPVKNCTNVTVMTPPNITKTAPADVVAPAETFTYSITYKNPNTVSLTGASITDTIPADLVFVTATTPKGNWSFEDDTVTWSLGTLAPNETDIATLTVHVGYLVPPGTDILNCAELETDLFDPVKNCTNVTVLFIPVINKTAPADVVAPGETFTYSIAYENPNTVNLTGAYITDYIESDLVFVNATTPKGNWSFEDDVVIWSLGTLAPNETGTVTLTVSVKTDVSPGTDILNCAELETDLFEEPIFDCTNVTVVVPPIIIKSAPSNTVKPGETFTYSIAYENPNTVNLTNVSITDTIPSYLIFVNAIPAGSFVNGTITWDLGTLVPYDTGIVNLTVTVKNDTPNWTIITNCAELYTDQFDPVENCTDVTVGCTPHVNLTKVSSREEVAPGESYIYTIRYNNSCCGPITGVTVSDRLPDEVIFISATHSGVYDGNNVTWSLGTVEACEEGELNIVVRVPLIAVDPKVTNVATLFYDQGQSLTATADTVLNPARIPDPKNLLVYPPVTKFISIPKSGTAPLSVRFMDFSSGKPTSWLWDFGDNTSSWLKNPTHIYTSPGSYTVTLTATNDWGAGTTIHYNEILVNNPIIFQENQVQPTGNLPVIPNYTSPYDRFISSGKTPFSRLFH